ncbi:putative phosphoglycerate mutase [Diaminobutyricimonas aerilata]|uniref:Putative phosphoglycerate mutase n=1 Tax=Diaminobutyricimonas aerilata TaxID=1162967 RepID=A0A2M9CJZ0_9MICO|nr:histidine phosphatase family protein [Diaminobutyricimonas aerilata]PJJ72188.1 putative phosphoglycerate mutase [Diaminobutyricimonas aerilata]
MTYLYLVRHGETDWNRARRIQGATDIPLNSTGREQAAATGRLLSRRRWSAIAASPLSRAADTARLIAREIGLGEPELVADLVERNYGEAEGLTWPEVEERFPHGATVRGRETREQVAERVVPALLGLAAEHEGESVVVVSHGGVIRAVLDAVEPGRHTEPISNGSVHSFRVEDGTLRLIAFDDPIEERSVLPGADDLDEQNALERR